MKKLLLAAFLLISFASQAQRMLVLPDTPTFANQNRGVWVFRIADNIPYYSNGSRWIANTGGLGPSTISDSLTAYNSRVVTSFNGLRGPVKGVDSLWFTASGTIMHWRWNGLLYSQAIVGGGGAGIWGTITGTLSDQTDLQTALNLKLSLGDTGSMLDPYLRKIDTTGKWVTTARRRADSVFMIVGGGEVFVFKDSIGSGSQSLDDVTTIGNFTTNSIRARFQVRNASNSATLGDWFNNANTTSELYIYNVSNSRQALLTYNNLEFKATGSNYQSIRPHASPSAAYTIFTLPNTAIDRYIPTTFKINSTTVAANDTGLVDLGTITSGTSDSIQNHTSGTTVTVTNGVNVIYINPASTLATLTITLPATPHASNVIEIYFGGTMTSGDVVTAITISPNTGQTLLQASTPSVVEAGEHISYRWNSSLSKWYRKH